MSNSPIAANVLGTIGTVLWCIQLVPQIWYNYRRKQTDGMPASMMMLWAVSIIPFGAYAIIQDFAIPLQVQPQAFGVLALITWGQVFYYDRKMPGLRIWSIVAGLCVLFGGVGAALTLGVQIAYRRGTEWPVILIGVVATVLLVAGFIPTFVEIWARKGRVLGISFVFLTIDSLGGIFSLLALVFQATFDPLGGVLYILIVVIEFGIAASHLIWRWRVRNLLTKAKKLGIPFDSLPEARPFQTADYTDPEPVREDLPRIVRQSSHVSKGEFD